MSARSAAERTVRWTSSARPRPSEDLRGQHDARVDGRLADRLDQLGIGERALDVGEPDELAGVGGERPPDGQQERDEGEDDDGAEDRQEQLQSEPLLPAPRGPAGPPARGRRSTVRRRGRADVSRRGHQSARDRPHRLLLGRGVSGPGHQAADLARRRGHGVLGRLEAGERAVELRADDGLHGVPLVGSRPPVGRRLEGVGEDREVRVRLRQRLRP